MRSRKTSYFVLIFVLATLSAFYFEAYYRRFIQFLYQYLTAGAISFVGKEFHFSSLKFALVFGGFTVLITASLLGRDTYHVIAKIFFTILLFFLSTMVISYFDSWSRVIGCTRCEDGRVRLPFSGIDYDIVFLSSLLVAILPTLIPAIRKHWKSRRQISFSR